MGRGARPTKFSCAMPTCIYCQRTDPQCGFNREHVIPEALGTFEGDVVTLTEEACVDCNQYFGDTLELFLNRDSAEAMFRFRYGLKDPTEVRKMFPRRLRPRLPRDGSKWGGAYLDLIPPPPGEMEPHVELAPQLACQRRDGGWEYFSEEDLRIRTDDAKEVIARECTQVRVLWAEREGDKQRLLALLAEKGIEFKGGKPITEPVPQFAPGRVNAELEFTFDKVLAQAVAKIGFNYFAKTQGAALALRPEFDGVRRFVRYGVGSPRDFVQFAPGPVNRDPATGKELPPRGHVVTAGWDADGKPEVIARVSLFQHITYLVRLCTAFDGERPPIDSAHLYDLTRKRAERLRSAGRGQAPSDGEPTR